MPKTYELICSHIRMTNSYTCGRTGSEGRLSGFTPSEITSRVIMDWVKRLSCAVMLLLSQLRHRRRVRLLLLIAAAIAIIITNYRDVFTTYHLTLQPRETKGAFPIDKRSNAAKACVLPKLDPFHESMISDKKFKDLGPLKCEGQAYTTSTNGILRIRKELRVSHLELKEIKRVPLNDFAIRRSDLPFSTQEIANKNHSVLYEGGENNISL